MKFGRGSLDNATCQMSRLFALWFETRRFLKFSSQKSIFTPCDLDMQRTGTIRTIIKEGHIRIIPTMRKVLNMVSQIYPSELQLNKANASDTEAAFLDLHLSISNGIVSTKIYDKRDDFDFEIVNFPFLDGDVPRSTSYGVYISQLIRFARASSYVTDFNTRNKLLTQKLLKQGYWYHKLRKTFSKFYR